MKINKGPKAPKKATGGDDDGDIGMEMDIPPDYVPDVVAKMFNKNDFHT